jgi:hypothetical protein
MKIHIDIDCTPAEARTFFGAPNVEPLQAALLKDVEERLRAGLASMDPETLMQAWLPLGTQGVADLQKMFWGQFAGATGGGGAGGKKPTGK